MEDLGEEANLGRDHGIVIGKEELELESAACKVDVSVLPPVRRLLS